MSAQYRVLLRFEHIELPAKLLDYFLRSNKSNINQSGTLLAVSAPLLTVNHAARAMAFFNPAKMPACSVWNPCDCLPNSGLKTPCAALLRDDIDVGATSVCLVLRPQTLFHHRSFSALL